MRAIAAISALSTGTYLNVSLGLFLIGQDTSNLLIALVYWAVVFILGVGLALASTSMKPGWAVVLVFVFAFGLTFAESYLALSLLGDSFLSKYDYVRTLSVPVTLPTSIICTLVALTLSNSVRASSTKIKRSPIPWVLLAMMLSLLLSSNYFTSSLIGNEGLSYIFWHISEDAHRYGLLPVIFVSFLVVVILNLADYFHYTVIRRNSDGSQQELR